MENGCLILQDTHFPIHHFGYNNIWENIFLRSEEALVEIRQKLVFLTKLSSVQEKINLKHIYNFEWLDLKLYFWHIGRASLYLSQV